LRESHSRTVGTLLARIPIGPGDPLLNFQLQSPADEPAEWHEPIDVTLAAQEIVRDATEDELQSFASDWRDGTDLMAQALAQEARFSLIRPMQTFQRACESLCAYAEQRLGKRRAQSAGELIKRGLMLVRLNRHAQAVPLLEQALAIATPEQRYEAHQSLALAHQPLDVSAAIHSLTCAIACAPHPELACGLRYNRGVLRMSDAADDATALEDFSYVIEHSANIPLRHSGLRARARVLTRRDDHAGAIADYTRVIEDAQETPRTAVSSWMDRGMLFHLQGRTADAIADWTLAINAADAGSQQRFRLLEARAELLEIAGNPLDAATDLEAMAAYTTASHDDREELRAHAARLRER
jgi:tetratricopeptide (TPR) repeat protein